MDSKSGSEEEFFDCVGELKLVAIIALTIAQPIPFNIVLKSTSFSRRHLSTLKSDVNMFSYFLLYFVLKRKEAIR